MTDKSSGCERRVPGACTRQLEEFRDAFSVALQALMDQSLSHLANPENTLVFRHGRDWEFVREDESVSEGGYNETRAEFELKKESQVASDMSEFKSAVESLVQQFAAPMSKSIYDAVAKGAEEVGNVVSFKDHESVPEAFLKIISTLEFSVDAQGNVTMPTMRGTPEQMEKMWRELDLAGPEFEARVEEIKAKKTEEALQHERERIANFKSRPSQ